MTANNTVMPEVYFAELKKLVQELSGNDLLQDGKEMPLPAKHALDVFFAGISCKSYTMNRSGRQFSWMDHGDIWQIEAYLRLLLALLPKRACLENVGGFMRGDTSGNGSPLLRFLQAAKICKCT